MKCGSRSTLGVGIGCINVFGFFVTIIYTIKVLYDFGSLTDEDKKDNEDVWSATVTLLYVILVICGIAIIISSLLIVGIIKRRHSLMRPWVYCAIAGIVCHIFRLIVSFLSEFLSGAPIGFVFSEFFVGSVFLGIQLLIFYPIYKLYKDICVKNNSLVHEEADIDGGIDNPPSYGDLERKEEM